MAPTRRIGHAGRVIAFGLALVLAASACGGDSSRTEYKDPNDLALFKVPSDWNVYNATEVSNQPSLPFAINFADSVPISSIMAFDAAPGRNPVNLAKPIASVRYPVGTYVVRQVSRSERELLSRGSLESLVLWPEFYTVVARGAEEEVDLGNEFEGIRRILRFEDVTTQDRGMVAFVSVTNPDDSLIYSMAVGCSEVCFDQYNTDIIEVIESWAVNTRK